MSGKEEIIKFENVSFSYNNETKVLDNVCVGIHERESIFIVGPNGGGKTTLLKLILGLLKPDSGKLSVFGGDPRSTRKKIGYTPQYSSFDPLFPVNVLDIVLMGRLGDHILGWHSKADKKAAFDALDELGIADLAKRSFSALSGGQKQRVLIARALVCDPELLLLDEPTANVDPAVEELLYAILEELNKRMAVAIVSHDIAFVSKNFESVICVNKEVHVHPTSEITGELINDIYGSDLRLIRHDHCSVEGHSHD